MKLHILGSGTAIPHPLRGASGYACEVEGRFLLLECGPGSTRRWPAFGIGFDSVDAIFVTHHHVDHCADLAPVLFGRNVVEPPVRSPLMLLGPEGHERLIAGLRQVYGGGVHDPFGVVEVREMGEGGRAEVAPFAVESRLMEHAPGALGVRVRGGGRSLAFSGDSGPCEALVELCRGADLALLECSYPASRPSSHHLNAATAAEVAREAGVKRLVLTHFYPSCDAHDIAAEVRSAGYEGELTLASDGDTFAV